MNQAAVSMWEQIKPKFYIFCTGLVAGILIGWFMHGVIGTIIKIFLILLILVPVVAAVLFGGAYRTKVAKLRVLM